MGETIELELDQLEGVRLLEPLLTLSPDAMFIVDGEGTIVGHNEQMEVLFGFAPGELKGLSVDALVPDELRPRHHEHRDAYLADSRRREMGSGLELSARRHDGSTFPVAISINPVRIVGVRYVVGAVRDITERRAAEHLLKRQKRELERSNEELEQFAYVASHDLQEPLRMVASYSQLLERRYKDKLGDDASEFIGFIVDGASRMQALIDDLLLLSRVERKGGELVALDPQRALDRALSNLQLRIQESGAKVTQDALVPVVADESQLTQLFQNLIGNALKFHAEKPPQVHVGCEEDGDVVRLSVRDSGIGIEPQYLERIFGVFQRLHARGDYEGTGVGLAICKKIVERHGGQIEVDSTPGEGTCFSFTFARAPEAST